MTEGFSKKPALSRKRKAIDNPSSFKMHAGSKLQFEILKELNHVPRHGYEIFQILQEKRLLSDRSDVYKIIRAMKAKDIITSTSVPSKRGYPKEILQLTEHGKDLYLQHVIGSLRENEILMSERLASNCGITMIQLVSSFIEMDGSRLQVMVDNDHGSHDRVLPLMKRLFEPVRKQVNGSSPRQQGNKSRSCNKMTCFSQNPSTSSRALESSRRTSSTPSSRGRHRGWICSSQAGCWLPYFSRQKTGQAAGDTISLQTSFPDPRKAGSCKNSGSTRARRDTARP
jgi:DNA-binding PadR family transcriptional regulator